MDLYEDTDGMVNSSRGGNDVLTGGGSGSSNCPYGDARGLWDFSVGGDDTPISGTGTDHMWGVWVTDGNTARFKACTAVPDREQASSSLQKRRTVGYCSGPMNFELPCCRHIKWHPHLTCNFKGPNQ